MDNLYGEIATKTIFSTRRDKIDIPFIYNSTKVLSYTKACLIPIRCVKFYDSNDDVYT